MQTTLSVLIKAVEGEMVKRKLDQRAFCSLLRIHETNWSRVRNGKRTPSLNLLTLLKQKLPEVGNYVDDYLDHRNLPKRGKQGNDGGEEKPLKKTGVKKTSPYLGHGNPETPPEKPSKNAAGG